MTPGSKKGRRTSSAPPIIHDENVNDDTESAYSITSNSISITSSKRKSARGKRTTKKPKFDDEYMPKKTSFDLEEPKQKNNTEVVKPKNALILVSDKRRGVYECDYCRRDISQVPRIRCAVCPDFDSCLECFPTSIPAPKADGNYYLG